MYADNVMHLKSGTQHKVDRYFDSAIKKHEDQHQASKRYYRMQVTMTE